MSGYNKNKHYFHLRSHIFPAYIILHHTHWERKFTSCVRPTSKQLANMLSTSWGKMDRCGNWMSETASLKPRRSSSDQKTQSSTLPWPSEQKIRRRNPAATALEGILRGRERGSDCSCFAREHPWAASMLSVSCFSTPPLPVYYSLSAFMSTLLYS
jgi:hypothetical protein